MKSAVLLFPQMMSLITTPAAAGVSPFYAFEQSDLVGRTIVLLLFGASVVAWSIMVEKWLHLKRVTVHCGQARAAGDCLRRDPADDAPMEAISRSIAKAGADLTQQTPEQFCAAADSGTPVPLEPAQSKRLRAVAEAAVDREIMKLEARLGLLSSIVSASPFLGLLGTVWGVMMAFTGMAMQGRADIKAIAPGVSGALLTTVVGLLVAIPAVIGYNFLLTRVKLLTVTLDNYAEDLLTRIQAGGSE